MANMFYDKKMQQQQQPQQHRPFMIRFLFHFVSFRFFYVHFRSHGYVVSGVYIYIYLYQIKFEEKSEMKVEKVSVNFLWVVCMDSNGGKETHKKC